MIDVFPPFQQAQKLQVGATVIYQPQHPKFIDTRYLCQEAVVVRSPTAELEGYYIKFQTGVVLLVSESDIHPI